MKKLLLTLLLIGLIVCIFVGCNVTTPTEGEEGGEGEEEVNRVVLVELFSQEACASCSIVEPFYEQLADEYNRDKVVFVEERAYGSYSLDEIRDRYSWYFPSESGKGTPNILFNGFDTTHLHGSSSYISIKSKINLELGKDAKISIKAIRSSDSTTTTISGTIKNISSSTIDNLVINGMNFRNRGQTGLKYSVLDIFNEDKILINSLAPDAIINYTFTLENINWVANGIHGVIFVQDTDSSKKEILQASYIE